MHSHAITAPGGRADRSASRRSALRASLLAGVSLAVLPLAMALVTASEATAQGIAPGFDQTQVPRGDDNSSGPVTLPFTANFFGGNYTQIYVNNNGNVTFGRPLSDYTPTGLDADYRGAPIIAPFFADIDTTNAASGVTAYGTGTYAGRTAFGATWPAVGYFASKADKLNTFQVVLTERSDTGAGNFDITYNYRSIQFETGDASGGTNGLGGTSAAVGYSAGTGVDGTYYQLPGALVPGYYLDGSPFALATASNGGAPGQFLFPVRNGGVLFARLCSAGDNASTTTLANCGPRGVYGGGIFYTPTGALTLNVLQNTTITAAAGQDALLVMAATAGGSQGGNVAVTVDSSARIVSAAGSGIRVETQGGAGSATVANAGTIEAGTAAIVARAGTGSVEVANAGTLTAPIGIAAGSTRGNAVATNDGVIQGATVGIAAGSRAGVGVANSGQVTFGKLGLAAGGLFGPVTITNRGTLTQDATLPTQVNTAQLATLPSDFARFVPAGTAGIYARTVGGAVTVVNAGTVTASVGIDAAVLDATAQGLVPPAVGALTVYNSGLVDAALAIDTTASRGATQVVNAGTIAGRVALSAGSSFGNDTSGIFNPLGTSTFGGGSLTNAGIVNLGPDVTLAGLSSFTNASGVVRASGASAVSAATFTNAGTIDLQNGRAGDSLTINGNYVGQNGRVNLDVSTQTSSSDRLVITGSAGGTTGLNLLNLTPGQAFTTSPVLVQVNGAVSPGAFGIANVQSFGALDVALLTGALGTEGGSTVSLVTVPSAVGQSGTTAVLAAQSIAFQGGTAILDRVTQIRGDAQRAAAGSAPALPQMTQYAPLGQYAALVSKDPIAPRIVAPAPPSNIKPAVWARAFGDMERRTGFSTLTFGGANFGRDLGYSQATGGLLAGADVVISGVTAPDDGLILGVMGGYTTANVRLNQQAGRQDYDGGTVGAYATYLKGGFFADTLFKTDLLGLDITAPGVRQSTGLQNYNVLGNIGYRFDLPNALYIEPTAGLEYVSTVFDRTPVLAANAVPLQDGDAFRGRIGARLGTEFVQDNIRVEPSITGLVYNVFTESGTTATFGGGTRLTGLTNVNKARGEIQASINFLNLTTGLSGFLRADYRIGEDLLGGGGRAGIRYQW